MSNHKPNKPAKNHPWKHGISSKIHDWAREASYVSKASEISVANLESIKDKSNKPKRPQM